MTQSHEIVRVYPNGVAECACGQQFDNAETCTAHFASINSDPRRISAADQMWADASRCLDNVIEYVRSQEPELYAIAAENSDDSVLFDYMKGYIMESERRAPGDGHKATILFCAAAITRLVRGPRTNDVLAQLDKELEQDNDDH